MTFISYAQNFEDVMLWRALKHIKNGFYIDVGANDSEIESVTKAFYDQGWHGINIEPLPKHHANLMERRPLDINLQCAAGSVNGEIDMWDCGVSGWATIATDVIARQKENGYKGIFHKVTTIPLKDICTQYVTGDIHFLKIDAEGAEKFIIDGMNFSHFRPWILLIEATIPNSTEEVHKEWEHVLLGANYVFAYADGLNRFYVADERQELLNAFIYPPNIFDGFIQVRQLQLENKAQQAENRVNKAEAKVAQANERVNQAESKANAALMQYRTIINSRTWRMTFPLRFAIDQIKWFVHGCIAWIRLKPGSRPVCIARCLLLYVRNQMIKHAWLKARVLSVLRHFPRLENRFRRLHLAHAVRYATSMPLWHPQSKDTLAHLSPRAQQIFVELKSAMKKHQKEHD